MDMEQSQKALGAAMRDAADHAGMTQTDVAAGIARIVGWPKPYDQALISKWYRGVSAPSPDQLIAFEQLVAATPGSYTRHLGYLPLGVVPVLTVPDAIAADIQLTQRQRELLTDHWQELVEMTTARRRAKALTDPPTPAAPAARRRGPQR